MQLKFRTQIIKQREKNIQLSFWDLGKELLEIQQSKQYQEENYNNMKEYVESNFSFTYKSAEKYMQLFKGYPERLTVRDLGLSKALLLLQVPEDYHKEIMAKIEEKPHLTRNELQQTLTNLNIGTKPSYSDDPQEHIYKLIREFDQKILPLKEGIKLSITRWLEEASKFKDVELEKRKEIAKRLI